MKSTGNVAVSLLDALVVDSIKNSEIVLYLLCLRRNKDLWLNSKYHSSATNILLLSTCHGCFEKKTNVVYQLANLFEDL